MFGCMVCFGCEGFSVVGIGRLGNVGCYWLVGWLFEWYWFWYWGFCCGLGFLVCFVCVGGCGCRS